MKFSFFQEKKILFLEDSWLARLDFHLSHQFRLKIQSKLFDVIFSQFASIEKNLLSAGLYILGSVYVALQSSEPFLLILCVLLLGVLLSDQLCKWLFKRPIRRQRPAEWFVGEDKWKPTWRAVRLAPALTKIYANYAHFSRRSYSSMCSSHAANYLTQAILLSYFVQEFAPIFYGVAALVSLGRWYIGAHFASDILVGWLVGIGVAACMIAYGIPFLEPLL